VAGIEPLFAWLPAEEGEFADAWLTRHRRRQGRYFNLGVANHIRAFGEAWRDRWSEATRRSLLAWGFNTVANWSDPDFIRRAGLPYVWPMANFPTTETRIFRDFPDVFSDAYASAAAGFAEQLRPLRGDPLLVGYFLQNEPKWAFAGEVNLAEELIAHPELLASKDALARHLSAQYGGDAARLTSAWGTDYDAFERLRRPVDPRGLSDAARRDLHAFSRVLVERYTRVVCGAVKREDPNHLNLGMRYAWISSEQVLAAARLFDVFTLNMYRMEPAEEDIRAAAKASGRPVLIGEFHFGAPDVGLPATGLRGVPSQAERAKAYRHYVEQAAAMPDLVGTHYFHLNDQAVLGRHDGENFQIGLVDVCGRTYEAFAAAVTETHRRLYDVASGRAAPFGEAPVEIPKIGF
jgi:hypothetical protein